MILMGGILSIPKRMKPNDVSSFNIISKTVKRWNDHERDSYLYPLMLTAEYLEFDDGFQKTGTIDLTGIIRNVERIVFYTCMYRCYGDNEEERRSVISRCSADIVRVMLMIGLEGIVKTYLEYSGPDESIKWRQKYLKSKWRQK